MRALIVVDVQQDFVEEGSLAVAGGNQVAERITQTIDSFKKQETDYDFVVSTRDCHIDPGDHFATSPDYVDTWPAHCVLGTSGWEYAKPMTDSTMFDAEFVKGMFSASYSGFDGTTSGLNPTSLSAWLKANKVTEVDVVGLAFDYCVKATALDSVKEGFGTTVLRQFTASVNPDNDETTIKELTDQGVEIA